MRVADDERLPRAEVVDEGTAVRVPHARLLRLADEERRAADGLEGAHGRVHATRDQALRPGEQLLGLGHRGYCSGKTRMSGTSDHRESCRPDSWPCSWPLSPP